MRRLRPLLVVCALTLCSGCQLITNFNRGLIGGTDAGIDAADELDASVDASLDGGGDACVGPNDCPDAFVDGDAGAVDAGFEIN